MQAERRVKIFERRIVRRHMAFLRFLWLSLLVFSAASSLVACSGGPGKLAGGTATNASPAESASGNSKIRRIVLPHDEPVFPPGKGKEIFVSACTVCHSLRYISMQPDLSEETWHKEVEKMRKNWGAHISDEEAKEIVDYLMLVKGKKTEKEVLK